MKDRSVFIHYTILPVFSGFCGAILATGLDEDYALGCTKGTCGVASKSATCGVVGCDVSDVVALDNDGVALTVDFELQFGTVFDVANARHVAKVHFVPLTCLRGEFDDVGVDDGDRDFLRTAMNSMTGNAGIVEDEGSTAS